MEQHTLAYPAYRTQSPSRDKYPPCRSRIIHGVDCFHDPGDVTQAFGVEAWECLNFTTIAHITGTFGTNYMHTMGLFAKQDGAARMQDDSLQNGENSVKNMNKAEQDIGLGSRTRIQIDPELERRVRRKLDWHIIPLVSALYLLAFLDRSNIG